MLGLEGEGEICEAVWQPVISDFLNNAFCGTHKVTGNGNGDQLSATHTIITQLTGDPKATVSA